MFEILIALTLCLVALVGGTFVALNALEDAERDVRFSESLTQ